jgi:hypothetical protein
MNGRINGRIWYMNVHFLVTLDLISKRNGGWGQYNENTIN